MNVPRLNPSHTGWYSIYLPWMDGGLSWPWWLVTEIVAHPGSNHLVATRLGVELMIFRSWVQRRDRYATRPPVCVYVSLCVCLSVSVRLCACRFSCLAPKYFVQDAQHQTVLVIEGPVCILQGPCCAWDQEFVVCLCLSVWLSLSVFLLISLHCVSKTRWLLWYVQITVTNLIQYC